MDTNELTQFNQVDPQSLATILSYTIPARENVMITGKPGIGKSEIVLQVCRKIGAKVIFIHAVVSDPTDAKGMPWVKMTVDGEPQAVFIPFRELSDMIEADSLTVVFLDDFGQAPPSVQAAFMQLLLARRINDFEISEQVVFIAATNRRQDLAGVSGILEPVKSRFTVILELVTSHESWKTWALGDDTYSEYKIDVVPITRPIPKRPIAMEVYQFLRMKPEFIDQFEPTQDLINSPTPRTITNLSQTVKMDLPKEVQMPMFAGAVGNAMGSQFYGFMEFYSKIPDIDLCIARPKEAPVPPIDDPDGGASIMYALVGALAKRADEKNFGKIVEYIDRIPLEFQTFFLIDASTMKPELRDTVHFKSWAIKNANMLV